MLSLAYKFNAYRRCKGGFLVKIVFASTPGQEEKISELIQYVYSNVFPLYFSDTEIKKFKRLKVLHASTKHFEYFSTLREAFQVITCLQTLISILESPCQHEHYEAIFNKNALMLNDYDLHFPFDYDQLSQARNMKNNIFSVFTKAANELLI